MCGECGSSYFLRLERLKCPEMQLKPEQMEAIRHVYEGKGTFVWLPTGFGKSICYEVLPFMFDYRKSRELLCFVGIVARHRRQTLVLHIAVC